MNKAFYELILNKKHHSFRHEVNWNLADEYASKRLTPIERMVDRFERLCKEETPVIFENEQIVFVRTVSNLPAIFTENEWNEIKSKHFIHELGFMSNLSPNYYNAIATGLLAKKENADADGKRVIDAILDLSDRYLNEAKKLGRDDVVEVLAQVPRYPARKAY